MSLTTADLEQLASHFRIALNYVGPKDLLREERVRYGGFIVNLNNHNQPGSHWVCAYLTKYRGEDLVLYFDAFGVIYPLEIQSFFKALPLRPKVVYNQRDLQNIASSECGWFCLSFLYHMTHKRTHANPVDDFQDFLGKFKGDPRLNLPILKASFLPYRVNFYEFH
jgi:hypothetical protein